ncbi:MAG TPA: hypothetical protein VN397_02080, partial [Candidatus Methylomirabilis sp.]|nr:hypothetical protein [Candidatus Methylomirabilis sp.]
MTRGHRKIVIPNEARNATMGSRKERRRDRKERDRQSQTGGTPDQSSGSSTFRSVSGKAGHSVGSHADTITASLTAIYGESPAEARNTLKTMEHARRRTWVVVG